jgi:PAS domain S-box-containing protein
LQHGLERGEKIIYLTDHHVPDLILSYLEAAGVKPDPYLASGQLRVVELEEVLADLPVPGPEGLLPLLAQEAGQAQAEGFAGLRFTYEMTWAIKNLLGADRLSDYGGKLGEFSRGSACLVMCQYDRRLFSPPLLLEVLAVHPLVIAGTEVLDNIFFLPPREMLLPELAAARLSHWLSHLAERKRAVEALQRQTRELAERVKELDCLYDIARLLSKPELSLAEALQGVVERLPQAWQHPEITTARIILDGQEFRSPDFRETPWKISSDIVSHREAIGSLQVYYLENQPTGAAGPFLQEEMNLLDTVSRQLGRFAERARAEEALKQSELQYRNLVEQIPAITYVAALDENSTTKYISPQVEEILGFSTTDFQTDPDLWKRQLHPEDRPRVLAEVAHSHATAAPLSTEYRLFAKDGRVLWLRDEAWLVRDLNGQPIFLQGVMLDITERRRAEEELHHYHDHLEKLVQARTKELQKANQQLNEEIKERRQAEAALERSAEKIKLFAYSVIHDLKNPALGLQGLTNLLTRRYQDRLDDRGRKYCDQIVMAADQIVNLVKRINAYIVTKEVPLTLKTINLADIFQRLQDEFAEALEKRHLKWTVPPHPPNLQADGLYILRALRNLVDNALKYGGDKLSEIRIGCKETEHFLVLSVTDDGVGITLEDPGQLFGVFKRYETSIGIDGTGLGLAIVKEIAEKHGGTVWVESSPAHGTTFYLSIAK